MKTFAIVVPFFNEEIRIKDGNYFVSLCKELDADFYFVDDGSRDNTYAILQKLSNVTESRVIRLYKNLGKGEAIRAGLREASKSKHYRYYGYLDADGAFPATEVTRCIDLAKNVFLQRSEIEIYIASRIKLGGKDIIRSSTRHYLSRLIITLIGFRTKNMPYDSQSGLKLFRNGDEFQAAIERQFKTRWFFDLELMSRLGFQHKACIWEEPVNAWRDIKGSKIRVLSAVSILKEIFVIRRILSKS